LVHLEDVSAFVENLALEARVLLLRQAEESHSRDAFARTGLADYAEHLATGELEAHPVHRMHDPVLGRELDLEVLDLDQTLSHLCRPDARVEPGVQQIHDDAEEDDEERRIDGDAHDRRQVETRSEEHTSELQSPE